MNSSWEKLVGNNLPVVHVKLDQCLESCPCQHFIIDQDGKEDMLSAPEIVKLYTDRGLTPSKHFSDQVMEESFDLFK